MLVMSSKHYNEPVKKICWLLTPKTKTQEEKSKVENKQPPKRKKNAKV